MRHNVNSHYRRRGRLRVRKKGGKQQSYIFQDQAVAQRWDDYLSKSFAVFVVSRYIIFFRCDKMNVVGGHDGLHGMVWPAADELLSELL